MEQTRMEQIQALCTELADTPDKDFGWGKGKENARTLGYADEWLSTIPDAIWEPAAAVGNPFSVSPIEKCQTVVDLGCGAGSDACVAALLVGDKGCALTLKKPDPKMLKIIDPLAAHLLRAG